MVDVTARLAALLVVLAVLAPVAGVVAAAPPPPPAAYYGSLTVNGEPAPAGVTVTARIDGEVRGSLTTAHEGAYGGPGAFDDKLQVDGMDADDGAAVAFVVGGVLADASVAWHAGDVRRVDLVVTGDVELPGDGGGGGGGSGGSGGSGTSGETGTGDQSSSNATAVDAPPASVTVDRTGNETRVTVTNATANATVSVELDTNDSGGDVALDGLDVTSTAGGDFALNVTLHDELPDDGATVDEPPTDAVGYLQVDHSVPDEQIGSVEFRFRVSKTRLAERGLDPADVALYRYHDDEWTALETTLDGESATHYAFRAVSPGLSVFAIGSRQPSEAPVVTETPPPATATAAPPDTIAHSPTAVPHGAADDGPVVDPDAEAPPTGAVPEPANRSLAALAIALVLGLAAVLAGLVGFRRRRRRG